VSDLEGTAGGGVATDEVTAVAEVCSFTPWAQVEGSVRLKSQGSTELSYCTLQSPVPPLSAEPITFSTILRKPRCEGGVGLVGAYGMHCLEPEILHKKFNAVMIVKGIGRQS
jgi:hypothetical protein